MGEFLNEGWNPGRLSCGQGLIAPESGSGRLPFGVVIKISSKQTSIVHPMYGELRLMG
jgi:hypothetical protein